MALHALSEYASLAYTGPVEGTITLASTNMDLQELIMLHENNSDVAQTVEVPSLPTELFVIVDAAGEGCVLVQVGTVGVVWERMVFACRPHKVMSQDLRSHKAFEDKPCAIRYR